MVVLVTRTFIIITAGKIAEKSKNNSWYGVMNYAKNDKNWITLGKDDKISVNKIIEHCNFSNASIWTKKKMISIVDAIQECGCMNKVVSKLARVGYFLEKQDFPEFKSFLSIACRIETKEGNFSACDAFYYLQKEQGIKFTVKQRRECLDGLLRANKIKRSGLIGNNYSLTKSKVSNIPPEIKENHDNIPQNVTHSGIKRKYEEMSGDNSKKCAWCGHDNHFVMIRCEWCGKSI